ncbi:hypothetical protein QZM42_29420 [Burkholderia vietnamiensis]|uniref:hypothetical protein n=1 Tax=Burkholderia vietnamiensis TaxID=60552 RepID=UPI001D15051B|nr:hypothetical protein [Burkholderia vietnamiensis]MDN7412649.1 hypothetical protein [Burkholderia vietnamiensis]UEC01226.1 hypothetical protein LK462_21940 [Burkholderia vietnamiensis]
MKRAWEITHLSAIWLLIGIAFFTLARVWMIVARSTGSTKDFWDVATAIGTCGAVIVALYVSRTDRRRKAQDETRIARLTASAVTLRVGAAIALLREIRSIAESANDRIHVPPKELELIADMAARVTICSREEVKDMIPLPDNCADNIAGAIDRIRTAEEKLRSEAVNSYTTQISRWDALENAVQLFGDAYDLLAYAEHVCKNQNSHIEGALTTWRSRLR